MGEVVRVSWAVRIVFAFAFVAKACPIWGESWVLTIVLAFPLILLVPKRFKGIVHWFWFLLWRFIVFVCVFSISVGIGME